MLYIYIYIEREREEKEGGREKEGEREKERYRYLLVLLNPMQWPLGHSLNIRITIFVRLTRGHGERYRVKVFFDAHVFA